MTSDNPIISLEHVRKSYRGFVAVEDFNMQLKRGELLSLLGPSGCGKTTTLRMIGGILPPTSGTIRLAERDITHAPPHKRDTAMVFQNYALFPHLSVQENIAFGLRRRRTPRGEIEKKVAHLIGLMRLDGLAGRMPAQLSGGQQQRVAVARALAVEPSVLLMDEPFSNLDARLRDSTSLELRRLQQELQMTVILVTHDKNEALAISDKVAVMNGGVIEQIGSPLSIYREPGSEFVAKFVSDANLLEGKVVGMDDGECVVEISESLSVKGATLSRPKVGDRVRIAIRPDAISVNLSSQDKGQSLPNQTCATVNVAAFQGNFAKVKTDSGSLSLTAVIEPSNIESISPGLPVQLSWNTADVKIYPASAA